MENVNSSINISGSPNSDNSKDALQVFFDAIRTETYKPYKTDIAFFDDLLGGGLIRGTLTILLAAPGAGKTALCAQIGEAMAEHGKPVIYLNLEMTADQMLARSISGRATLKGTPTTAMQVMQGYKWTDKQREIITAAVEEYRQTVYPFLHYRPASVGADLQNIGAFLKDAGEAAKAAGKEAPAVVLDYLHLITGAGDPQETIKQALFMLKRYAADYGTVAIAISATNRSGAKNITMDAGRDSSGIEYTGDNILSLQYYEVDTKGADHVEPTDIERMAKIQGQEVRRMVLRVLKGRFIAPGRSANLQFYAPAARFYGAGDFIPAGIEVTPFDDGTDYDDLV